eukprot:s1890_g11.t1
MFGVWGRVGLLGQYRQVICSFFPILWHSCDGWALRGRSVIVELFAPFASATATRHVDPPHRFWCAKYTNVKMFNEGLGGQYRSLVATVGFNLQFEKETPVLPLPVSLFSPVM